MNQKENKKMQFVYGLCLAMIGYGIREMRPMANQENNVTVSNVLLGFGLFILLTSMCSQNEEEEEEEEAEEEMQSPFINETRPDTANGLQNLFQKRKRDEEIVSRLEAIEEEEKNKGYESA